MSKKKKAKKAAKKASSELQYHVHLKPGDVGRYDGDGLLWFADRKKDVIKSGGEWISSIDIENAAVGYPGVRVAAVVGVYHPKWEERPLLVIETHEGQAVTADAIRAHLETKVVRWWLPDDILFATVPLTATGKIDKKALREAYRNQLA